MQNQPIRHHMSRTGLAVNYNGQLHVWDNGQVFELIQVPYAQNSTHPVDRPRHNPYDNNAVVPRGYPQPQYGSTMGAPSNYGNQPPSMVPSQYMDPFVSEMQHAPVETPSAQPRPSGHSLSAFFAEDEDSVIKPTSSPEQSTPTNFHGQFKPVAVNSRDYSRHQASTSFEESIGNTHDDMDDSELEALALATAEQDYQEELNMNAEDHVYGLRERRLAEQRIADGIAPLPVADNTVVEEPVIMVWADDDEDFTYNDVISRDDGETDVLSVTPNKKRNLPYVDSEDLIPTHDNVSHEPVETIQPIVFLDEDEEDLIGTIRKPDEVPVADIAAAVDRINGVSNTKSDDLFTFADSEEEIEEVVDESNMTPAELMSRLSNSSVEIKPADCDFDGNEVSLFLSEINEDAPLESASVSDTLVSNIAIETVIAGDNNAFNIIAALSVCARSEEVNPYAIIKYETLSKLISPTSPITSVYNNDELFRIASEPTSELEDILCARAYEYYLTYLNYNNSDGDLDESRDCFYATLKGWLEDGNSKHYYAIYNLMAGGTNETHFNEGSDWIITATLPRCAVVLNLYDTDYDEGSVTLEQLIVSALRDMTSYTEILNEEFGSARDSKGDLLVELTESESDQYMPSVASYLTHAHGAQCIVKTTDGVIGLYTYYEWIEGRGYLNLQTTF